MARKPRTIVPGLPHHVIQRGNNRTGIFFDQRDYGVFMEWLGEGMQKYGCKLHAYVLMSNHIHLLLTPDNALAISRTLQAVGRRYVRYINREYRRTGTLWEGCFKSSVVDSERYLLTCYRYIEMNPVRAGMVEHPGGYRWSSYGFNGEGLEDDFVSEHAEYSKLGISASERHEAYRSLFSQPIVAKAIKEIRDNANRGQVLGGERFREEIERNLKRRVVLLAHGGDRRSKHFRGEG